jgi:hypothetical protein
MKPEPFAEATKLGEPHVSPPTTAAPSCLNDAVTRSGENLLVAQPRRAEEALRESERKLARAMSLARLVDWEYDVASGLFILGDLYYAVHGTTSELEGGVAMSAETFVRKFVHPDDAHLIGKKLPRPWPRRILITFRNLNCASFAGTASSGTCLCISVA